MNFQREHVYHVYNRGNNSEKIFFEERNYLFFLEKIKKELLQYLDILAYCLMPNHFHLMVYVKNTQIKHELVSEDKLTGLISKQFAVLLRSYTRAINIQENRSGLLFQQKTKAKILDEEPNNQFKSSISYGADNYAFTCFNYIHQNPIRAGIVSKLEDWEYSSFRSYVGLVDDTICNIELAKDQLDIDMNHFYEQSYREIPEEIAATIY